MCCFWKCSFYIKKLPKDQKIRISFSFCFLSFTNYHPYKSSCLFFGARIVSNVKFVTSQGRQLGENPFNSYGWCISDGKNGDLGYEGPYEQDLDWSRLDEQLVYVMGSDKKQYISAFKPIPGTFKCYLSPSFSKIWSNVLRVNSWANSYCLQIQSLYSENFQI